MSKPKDILTEAFGVAAPALGRLALILSSSRGLTKTMVGTMATDFRSAAEVLEKLLEGKSGKG